MEVFLSKQCESITGSLLRSYGYHIQRRTDADGTIRFWGVRKSKGIVHPSGHLLFILNCANLAQSKLHITDVRVSRDEMMDALWEAGVRNAADYIAANKMDFPAYFSAQDIINLKNKYNL
jgi:hypothetical protein